MSVAADFVFSLPYCRTEQQILSRLMHATNQMLGGKVADAQIFKDHSLHIVSQIGWPSDVLKGLECLSIEAGTACARAARYHREMIIDDAFKDEAFRPYRECAEYVGFRAIYSTPLISRGKLIGVNSVLFGETVPTDRAMANIVAQLAADAIYELRYG